MDDKKNIWLEHFNVLNNLNSSESAIERFQKIQRIANRLLLDNSVDNNQEKLQLMSIKLQAEAAVSILQKLDTVERAVREAS